MKQIKGKYNGNEKKVLRAIRGIKRSIEEIESNVTSLKDYQDVIRDLEKAESLISDVECFNIEDNPPYTARGGY